MVSGGLTDEEMKELEAPSQGLSDDEMNSLENKNLVDSFKGSLFEDEVKDKYLPHPDTTEQALRTVSSVGTFGAQPYISAGVKTLADKFGDYFTEKEIDPETGLPIENQSTFQGNVLNEQLRNEGINNPLIKGTGTVAKIARDVAMPAKSAVQRVGIPVATGMMEKAGESDLSTLEGWGDVGAAGLTNLATSAGLEGVSQGIKGAVGFGRDSKTFTKPELIERYLLSKKNRTPKGIENVVKNSDLLSQYSKEGLENVKERLGKNIKPFRDEITSKTDDIIRTPEAIKTMDSLNPSGDDFLNGIQQRLQSTKSSADVLQIADDIDDHAKSFYDKASTVNGKTKSLTKADRKYYENLVQVRNQLKDSIRDPEGPYGLADQAFSQFEKNKPLLQDIKDAEFKYQKSANPTLNIASESQSPTVPWSVSGIPASVANFLKKRLYQYGDPLSEELSKNAPDPQKILGLEGDFTQNIDFKPWLSNLGEGSNRSARGITNSISRGVSDQYGESPQDRFKDIAQKIPSMGPYQQEMMSALEKGKLPILHFYLMKTDPNYQALFNQQE
jgi:hypothetical protein